MIRAPLKTHFFRGSGVSPVLKPSCIVYTLWFSVRIFSPQAPTFGATTKKSLFLEAPMNLLSSYLMPVYIEARGCRC